MARTTVLKLRCKPEASLEARADIPADAGGVRTSA
jgi:hypothetical protein